METGLCYRWLVAGTGQVEELVAAWLTLPEPAAEILEWRKTVLIHQSDVVAEGVVLTGNVRTRCLFTAPGDSPAEAPPERVLCRTADIGFIVYAPVTGAAPGMSVTVTEAHVLSDVSIPAAYDGRGLIVGLLDRSIIRLQVRVVTPDAVPVHKEESQSPSTEPRPRKKRRRRPRAAPAPDPVREAKPPASQTWIHPSTAIRPGAQRE